MVAMVDNHYDNDQYSSQFNSICKGKEAKEG